MDQEQPGDITRLLHNLSRGEKAAEEELIPLVYSELRRLAARYMRGEADGQTLQTTALVHEAYLKLVRNREIEWQSRAHFFAVAATIMRRILVDHARSRQAEKRGGGVETLKDVVIAAPSLTEDAGQVLALDEALNRLAEWDRRQCRIVELRFFAGMSIEETAEVLRISPRTVKREWQLARAWLFGELTRSEGR